MQRKLLSCSEQVAPRVHAVQWHIKRTTHKRKFFVRKRSGHECLQPTKFLLRFRDGVIIFSYRNPIYAPASLSANRHNGEQSRTADSLVGTVKYCVAPTALG